MHECFPHRTIESNANEYIMKGKCNALVCRLTTRPITKGQEKQMFTIKVALSPNYSLPCTGSQKLCIFHNARRYCRVLMEETNIYRIVPYLSYLLLSQFDLQRLYGVRRLIPEECEHCG